MLLMYKHADDKAFLETQMEEFFKFYDNREDRKDLLRIFALYLFQQADMEHEKLEDMILDNPKIISPIKKVTMSVADQLIRKGELKGELRGELRGEIKGMLKGKLEGKLEGELVEKHESVKRGWEMGLSIEVIAKVSGLSIEDVTKLIDGFKPK